MRISLSEEDFARLVAGEVVTIEGVEIALQDIGFPQMRKAINRADPEQPRLREERKKVWDTRRVRDYMRTHPDVSLTEATRIILDKR